MSFFHRSWQYLIQIIKRWRNEGFIRIAGGHQADNPASGKVMAKAGMKCEGVLRQDFMNVDGTLVDSILYSIIKQDLSSYSIGYSLTF